uniref:Uncharacterized protein n=1 Tax=Tetranychus urticae TaxID=32264 RepID=T1KXX2_TETUR
MACTSVHLSLKLMRLIGFYARSWLFLDLSLSESTVGCLGVNNFIVISSKID